MRRLLLSLALFATLLPAPAAAVDTGPLPVPPPFPSVPSPANDCPPVDYIDGVPVPPSNAPVDCVYITGGGEVDPCAPDATGNTPEMCQTGPIVTPELPTYEITAINLADGSSFAPSGAQITIGDGALSATVGCNRIGGAASLGESGSLEILQLMTTEMYCIELADDEQALLTVLGGGNLRFTADDTGSSITSSSGSITLRGAVGPLPAATSSSLFPAALLLMLPLLAGAVAILLALGTQRERRR